MVGTLKFVKYKVGGTQNLELYRNKIPFLLKYVLMHVKPEGMTQFDVFSYLCRQFSELGSYCFSELYSKQPESEMHQKMPMFEHLKNQIPVNSKLFLIPH